MAKLSAGARRGLPASDFAGKGRTFPVEDADHARAAIIDASYSERLGHITPAERDSIVNRAEAILRRHPLHP